MDNSQQCPKCQKWMVKEGLGLVKFHPGPSVRSYRWWCGCGYESEIFDEPLPAPDRTTHTLYPVWQALNEAEEE